jgi:hypothetical protein
MVRTTPFTSFAEFVGSAAYFLMPQPKAPAIRAQAPPPVIAPTRGAFGFRKANLPPAVSNTYQSTALSPQGPLTYIPGTQAGIPTNQAR